MPEVWKAFWSILSCINFYSWSLSCEHLVLVRDLYSWRQWGRYASLALFGASTGMFLYCIYMLWHLYFVG